jgi:hypothetical protein
LLCHGCREMSACEVGSTVNVFQWRGVTPFYTSETRAIYSAIVVLVGFTQLLHDDSLGGNGSGTSTIACVDIDEVGKG